MTSPRSLETSLDLGRKARADSLPTSVYSFSRSVNFFCSSGPISPESLCCSTSFNREAKSLRCCTRVLPSLEASWIRLSVSFRCASSARFACVGELDEYKEKSWLSNEAYRWGAGCPCPCDDVVMNGSSPGCKFAELAMLAVLICDILCKAVL